MNARRATGPLASSRWSAMRPPPRRCTLPAPRTSAESSASRQQAFRGSIAASSSRTSTDRLRARRPPARAAAACTRCRASRSSPDRRTRPRGDTGRRAGSCSRRRRCPRRAARGRPASAASSPYVTTSPQGTARSASASACWNGVPHSASSSTSSKETRSPRKYAQHSIRQRMLRARGRRGARARELVVEELPGLEVELADPQAGTSYATTSMPTPIECRVVSAPGIFRVPRR